MQIEPIRAQGHYELPGEQGLGQLSRGQPESDQTGAGVGSTFLRVMAAVNGVSAAVS